MRSLPDCQLITVTSTSPSSTEHCFVLPIRVYYEDTDTAGVVYYANYLKFFERCRSEWIRAMGFGQHDLVQREQAVFVVAHVDIKYRAAARLDDVVRVDARVVERFGSYVVFEQNAWRDTELLAHGRVKVACVDATSMRPRRIPEALQRSLEAVSTPVAASR
jgi:acyl-CoA thioester hydrolase